MQQYFGHMWSCERPFLAPWRRCACSMLVGICVFLPSLLPTNLQECPSNLWSSSGQMSCNIFLLQPHRQLEVHTNNSAVAKNCCPVSSGKIFGGRTRYGVVWKQTDGHKEALLLTQTLKREKKYNIRDVVDYPDLGLNWHGLCLCMFGWGSKK